MPSLAPSSPVRSFRASTASLKMLHRPPTAPHLPTAWSLKKGWCVAYALFVSCLPLTIEFPAQDESSLYFEPERGNVIFAR